MQLSQVIEIIGVIAFAASGALTGIRKNLDIFGICVLAVITALGGGLIRDIILGVTPPYFFTHPIYTVISIGVTFFLFVLFRVNIRLLDGPFMTHFDAVMGMMDNIGLGFFTVSGMMAGINAGYSNRFLLIFAGMLTGIGGGICRDIMASQVPGVFVRHVYAVASLIGALVFLIVRSLWGDDLAMILGSVVIIVIRILATVFKWNLPRVRPKNADQ